MSEDLTRKLPKGDTDNVILTAVQNLDAHIRSSFDQLVGWVGSIDSRLKNLEQKVEERLHDTRPIWNKVVADIEQLHAGQQGLRAQVSELNSTVRDVNRDQIVINDVMRRIQLDFHNLDERLHGLVNRCPHNSST